MSPVRLLVTDLDNTLYSWVGYVLHAIDAMLDSLQATTGLNREAILASLQEVYSKKGSIEYPFVIQEASIFQGQIEDFESFAQKVILPARKAFASARMDHLRLYPGVMETLQALRAKGIHMVALSDASAFSATLRVRLLGLDQVLEAIYAIVPYPLPPKDRIERGILEKLEAGFYDPSPFDVVELPLYAIKPSPDGLQRILARFGVKPREAALIGDNLKKDVGLAQSTGLLDIWARYGTRFSPGEEERLRKAIPREVMRRNAPEAEESSLRPTHLVDRFDELLEILA